MPREVVWAGKSHLGIDLKMRWQRRLLSRTAIRILSSCECYEKLFVVSEIKAKGRRVGWRSAGTRRERVIIGGEDG